MNQTLRWVGIVSVSLTATLMASGGDFLGAAFWCVFGAAFFFMYPTLSKHQDVAAFRLLGWATSIALCLLGAFQLVTTLRHLPVTR